MIFTHHAVERYRQFHMLDRPGATDEDARSLLEAAAPSAVRGGSTHRGDPMWMLPSLGIEVVAKHEDGQDVVVTVLPPARFRFRPDGTPGLTPLQVEAIELSVGLLDAGAADLQAEVDALPRPPLNPSADKRRQAHLDGIVRADAKRQLQIALIEKELFAGVARTARHQATLESQAVHKALAIAVKALRELARDHLQAGLAIAAIEGLLE